MRTFYNAAEPSRGFQCARCYRTIPEQTAIDLDDRCEKCHAVYVANAASDARDALEFDRRTVRAGVAVRPELPQELREKLERLEGGA